jgi:pantoate--beta-alanine ligase
MALEVVDDAQVMQLRMRAARRQGLRIAFVPTMGYLHEGHVALLAEGRRRGDVLVLSIFVNPTQFAPSEDLERYPRDLPGDLEKARAAGTDLVFAPGQDFYPPGYQTWVSVRELSSPMCGASRPGHFDGVASVVAKLFHVVQPDVAIFGEKDWQQLAIVRRMVRDLDFGIEIAGVATVRESDGLALSSRNKYLSAAERRDALCLSRALGVAAKLVEGGEREAAVLLEAARAEIAQAPSARVDYLEVRDPESLMAIKHLADAPALMAMAVFVGRTRLIDNRILRP